MVRSHPAEQHSSDTIDTINLARALSRLEAKILTSDPHSRLRHSPYERAKTAANLEYARTLLLRLEHSTSAVKTQSRKHAAQETLLEQRNLIKRLNDRLYELGQQDDGTLPSDSSEDEDILAALGERAPQTPANPILSPAAAAQPQAQTLQAPSSPTHRSASSPTASPPEPTSTLRSRRPPQTTPASTTTAHGLDTSKTSLFPSKPSQPTQSPPQKASNSSQNPSTASLLESQTTTQVDLTTSLLQLATQLKTSAQAFSTDLATDSATLAQTESALGKNKEGLDAASSRMGTLRKMSEGRWWWGRMALYAGIGALWVVAILLVFGGPKIRF